jgi:hypothetical protein
MSLTGRTRLGSYEILAPIEAGGMGLAHAFQVPGHSSET